MSQIGGHKFMVKKNIIKITRDEKELNCKIIKTIRGSIKITISHKNGVIVKSPIYVPNFILSSHISDKKDWIFDHFYKLDEIAKRKEKKYIAGEEHYFMGNKYKLEIQLSEKENVSLSSSSIIVKVSRNSPKLVKSLWNGFLHERAVEIIFNVYETACQVFIKRNIIPKTLIYKRLKGKWGACSFDNTIYINPDLVKTPLACLEYVIYHELCHVLHHNHSKQFYSLLNEMMPDWKFRRKKLRDLETEL
jgi:predicted metal-dependent hydrolase